MNTMVKHIQNIFIERCRANEQYSLRAFAKSLDTPVSSLSEIMNEKRPLSKKLLVKFGQKLNMSQDQLKIFSTESTQKSVDADYRQIALDSFYIISEWYHYGILQLIRTRGFKNDHKWIAERLGLQSEDVTVAIQRLMRVGILEMQEDGTLVDITNGETSHLKSDFTNEQLRNFQIKALEQAIHGLKTVPVQLRDNTSMTMAISKKAIPFAKQEIKKFRRQLTKKLEAFDEPDEVYQLAISLSPLTDLNLKNTGENS